MSDFIQHLKAQGFEWPEGAKVVLQISSGKLAYNRNLEPHHVQRSNQSWIHRRDAPPEGRNSWVYGDVIYTMFDTAEGRKAGYTEWLACDDNPFDGLDI